MHDFLYLHVLNPKTIESQKVPKTLGNKSSIYVMYIWSGSTIKKQNKKNYCKSFPMSTIPLSVFFFFFFFFAGDQHLTLSDNQNGYKLVIKFYYLSSSVGFLFALPLRH